MDVVDRQEQEDDRAMSKCFDDLPKKIQEFNSILSETDNPVCIAKGVLLTAEFSRLLDKFLEEYGKPKRSVHIVKIDWSDENEDS